jgi:hypothetical protein
LPSLCRIFANGDSIVELVPFGPEDEPQASQESDYLNYLVTQKNNWFNICLEWFHDALLTKNAYCMPHMDQSVQVEKERYVGQSEEAVALLMQDPGVEVVAFQQYPDPDTPPQPVLDPFSGQPVMDDMGNPVLQPIMLADIEIRRTRPKNKLCFQVLPPERCKTAESTPDWSLENTDYFEDYDFKTISSLRSEGFDIPDDIAHEAEDADSEEDEARDQFGDELTRVDDRPSDPSMKRVRARMIWIRHDYDEDGIAELQYVLRVGRTVLHREEVTRIPVASIVPYPNPHRHMGLSVADIVADLQSIKSVILRGGLDSLYLANNPRTVINDLVSLDDMLISRPGGIVRSEGDDPVQQNFAVIGTPDVFPQAMQGMEYLDRIRESRTGVSRQFAGIENDTLLEAKSATEASQLSTMAAQRVEQIARIFASGVECLFSIAHELVLRHGHKAEVVKLRGEWVSVDPSTWRTGRDMQIVVGFGAGNKDALASRIMTILNVQKEAVGMGLRIANEANIYEAVVELTKASDFTAPQRFWTDPRTLPPPQPKPTEAEIYAATEQKKLETSEREKGAELRQRERDSSRKALLDEYRANLEAEVRIVLEQVKQGGNADLEQIRNVLKNAPTLADADAIQEAGSLVAAISKAANEQNDYFAESINALGDRLESVVASISAPREVVRDGSGRVTGVKMNGETRPVKRDRSGRIKGV